MIKKLAWVSTRLARGQDTDEPLAIAALAATGVVVDVVDWNDPSVHWASYDRVILRSTWDYADHLEEFMAWVEVVAAVTDLRNSPAMVAWSLDKRYLLELSAAGVPAVPTAVVSPGEEADVLSSAVVVKPAIGAGSRDAASYQANDLCLASAHVQRLLTSGRTAIVQPLLTSVAAHGEWALIYLAGTHSHSVNKRVSLSHAGQVKGLFAPQTATAHLADPDQLAVAGAVIEHVSAKFGVPTYARVDLVRGDDGQPQVLEVELVEPTLFLQRADNDAPARLARVLTT